MAVTLFLMRAHAPGAVLWEQVAGIVGADARGRATAEIIARKRHAEAEGAARVVVVERSAAESGGRVVLDLPAAPWGAHPLLDLP